MAFGTCFETDEISLANHTNTGKPLPISWAGEGLNSPNLENQEAGWVVVLHVAALSGKPRFVVENRHTLHIPNITGVHTLKGTHQVLGGGVTNTF